VSGVSQILRKLKDEVIEESSKQSKNELKKRGGQLNPAEAQRRGD
jgi:hypothetical protein